MRTVAPMRRPPSAVSATWSRGSPLTSMSRSGWPHPASSGRPDWCLRRETQPRGGRCSRGPPRRWCGRADIRTASRSHVLDRFDDTGYAPQRHRLPLIRSRISWAVSRAGAAAGRPASVAWDGKPSAASSSMPTAEQIWPGVQYPHCRASRARKASCMGCSPSPSASPSTVVIAAPSCATASSRQLLARRPSTMTVHAPHWP